MYSKIAIITVLLNISVFIPVKSGLQEDILHRSRRQLLFPNSTLLQLNIGVGTPTPIKTININWAFQANFQLPWNRSQIPVDIFGANSGYVGTARKRRELTYNDDDTKLYDVYKYVGDMLNGFGQNGTSCVLRTLCQLGAQPLHSVNNEDLLHEIATFVLNPLNDIKNEEKKESNSYIEAYKAGQRQTDCDSLYNECSLPLIDMFSELH